MGTYMVSFRIRLQDSSELGREMRAPDSTRTLLSCADSGGWVCYVSAMMWMGYRRSSERLTAPCIGVDMVAMDCQYELER